MIIKFYRSIAENNRLDKTDYLETELSVEGTLKDSSSIVNPSIVIEHSGAFSYNYAYIADFSRWYFITNIESVRNNLWRISMRCDVLMSFKDQILENNALISRNEYRYDEDLIDSNVIMENGYDHEYHIADNTPNIFTPYDISMSCIMLEVVSTGS